MKKLSKSLFFLFLGAISSGYLFQNGIAAYASESLILRYANDNLSTLGNLNDFNINTNYNGSNLAIDANQGIVMTTSTGQASSLFFKEQMAADINNPGFSTYFVMNVYKIGSSPADGYVFVVAANSNALGALGGGLGYQNILNSLGIEFDFYNNSVGSIHEQIASADVFQNGSISSTVGTQFDSGFLSKFTSSSTPSGALVRSFHTWIEYDATNLRLELRVALSDNEDPTVSRPARPVTALITKTNFSLPQLSSYFYAGFTAATGGLAQRMALKSWYFSNAFISGGIIPTTQTYVVDTTPPTVPTLTGMLVEGNHTLTLSGGTDNESSIAGYQYKVPGGNWTNYSTPVTMNALGEYQGRSVDQAGNYSTFASLHRYEVQYSVNGSIVHRVPRLSTDDAYTVDYVYELGIYGYQSWYSSAALTGDPVAEISPRTTAITIYGKPEQVIFALNYVLNDGHLLSPNPIEFRHGEVLTLTNPIKDGHTFSGWFFDEALTLPVSLESLPQENVTLYAGWNLTNFSLNIFVDTTETVVDVPYLSSLESILEAQNPEKVGHTFAGWFLDETLSTPILPEMTMPANPLSIYAKWDLNQYSVTFQSNGGSLVAGIDVDYGAELTSLEEPVANGFTFGGWYLDPTITTPVELPFTMPADDVTFYARWLTNAYRISFETNGGTALQDIVVNYQGQIQLPTNITKQGHEFSGWFLDETFNEPFTNETMTPNDLKLFAKWQIKAYTIVITSTHLSTPIATFTIDFDQSITLPEAPVRTGYRFDAWVDDEGEVVDESWRVPARDVTIQARWLALSSTITFVLSSGNIQETFITGESLGSLPIPPEKEGYIFLGWSLIPHDPSGIISENDLVANGETIMLYPVWEKLPENTIIQTPIELQISLSQPSQDYRVAVMTMISVLFITVSGLIIYWLKEKRYGTL